MASQIPNTYVTKYSSNMRMALNQQEAILATKAMEETGSGEMYQLQNIVGNGKVKKRATRNADVVYDDATHDRVWVAQPGQDYDADLVDKIDKVASGIDLQSGYVQKHAGTIRRAWDGAFLGGYDGTGGFYGNMLTGKTGGTLTPFASANIIPVTTGAAAATGMNVEKVLAARETLAAGFVNMQQNWYMGVTANEVTDLFNQVQVTSADFKETYKARFSADGKSILGLAGFEFVEIELNNPDLPWYELTKDGSGYQQNPFWTADGMSMVYWEKLETSIDRLPTKFNAIQILATTMVTATRTDNARCGIILNN